MIDLISFVLSPLVVAWVKTTCFFGTFLNDLGNKGCQEAFLICDSQR